MSKPRGLGRGLGAFFPEMEEDLQQNPMEIPVAEILPNPYQPRQEFPVESLENWRNPLEPTGSSSRCW